MRIACLLVIAACGASPPPVTPSLRAHPCERVHWRDAAAIRLRVWPAKASAPAHVVEVAGAHVEVASVTSSVIVTRWVPYASLEPIAMSATNVSPARGAAPDPALRILVGHRLDPPAYGWATVHAPDGFVPASFAGTMWTESQPEDDERFAVVPSTLLSSTPRDPSVTYRRLPERDRRYLRYASGEVRGAADDTAPVRFVMTSPMVIQPRAGAPNDYLAITVHLPFAELDGFWKMPPEKPRTPEEEAQGEIEYEAPALHSPIATGTCLYDAPRGRVIGMILDEDAFAPPTPSTVTGWFAVTIPTIWGPHTYYVDTPPIPRPPDPPPIQWGPEDVW